MHQLHTLNHRRPALSPQRPSTTPARRRRRPLRAVFLWSSSFDDESSSDDSDDADANGSSEPLPGEPDSYDDTVLGDAWRRPRGSGSNGPFAPDDEPDPTDENRNGLYATLRKHTTGPDDVDRLRALATESASDAFRRIVMGILGSIPGDTYEVVITSDRRGVSRLMQSSLSTGYALRNAEFRMVLNESMAAKSAKMGRRKQERDGAAVGDLFAADPEYMRDVPRRGKVDLNSIEGNVRWWDNEREAKQEMKGKDYMRKLEAENELLRERLAATQIHDQNNNKLMDFMRTLNPEKIAALQANLSQDAIDAFKEIVKGVLGELSPSKVQMTYSTSRDYLAQLTFWCLLAGYCIRNFEKRLEMTKVFEATEAFAEPSLRDFDFQA